MRRRGPLWTRCEVVEIGRPTRDGAGAAGAAVEPWEGKKEAISLPVLFLGSRAFPTLHFRPRVASRDVLSDRLPRKGSSGASLGDVPLAIGQPRQQLTSSAACEEAVFLRFVQNEPLERSLSVRES
jgi:hypothetical protein